MPRLAHALLRTLTLVVTLGVAARAVPALAAANPGACDGCASYEGVAEFRPGEPAPFARVLVVDTGMNARADELGRFHVTGIPAGRHTLMFHAPGSLPVSGMLQFGAGSVVRDTLRLPSLVSGVAPADSSGLASRVFSLDAKCGATEAVATTSAFRSVLTAHGRLGDYWLVVDRRIPSVLQAGYQLGDTAEEASIEFIDSAGHRLDREADRNQLAGDRTWEGLGQRGDEAMGNGPGRARFHAGGDDVEIPFCFEWRPPALPVVGEVDGTVEDSTGHPQAYANVVVLGTRRGALTDERGRFKITLVPPGTWLLSVYLLGFAPTSVPFTLGAGQPVELRVTLGPRYPALKPVRPLIKS